MKFIIQSIETKVNQILPKDSVTVFVFNFLQVGIQQYADISSTTEIILKGNDPRVEEWFKAFHEKRYFELSINPV